MINKAPASISIILGFFGFLQFFLMSLIIESEGNAAIIIAMVFRLVSPTTNGSSLGLKYPSNISMLKAQYQKITILNVFWRLSIPLFQLLGKKQR